ncbi:MAG: hypothetical protein GY822_12140 [Deltaproteobacteria bacterium]|nr:hypothetical protein [Deltaproteobacteria bacterium]
MRLIFVDETGFRLGDSPRYGWAPRGEDAIGKHVQGSRTTMTLIGAIALDGFRGMMTVNDGTGIDVMLAILSKFWFQISRRETLSSWTILQPIIQVWSKKPSRLSARKSSLSSRN